jgi:DNA-binding CsgD family transcriptional regulator
MKVTADQMEALNAFIHENPVFVEVVVKRRADAVILSDFVSARQFSNTHIYNEFYRQLSDANTQLAISLPVSSDFDITCQLNRVGRDFSERDRSILNLIAPHLVNAIRNAFAFERLNAALEKKESGVISIDGNGRMQFVSAFARRLLDRYFAEEKRADNSLPRRLWEWLKSAEADDDFDAPRPPLRISRADAHLTVRAVYNSTTLERTLLLEERRALTPQILEASLPVTRRESQVLFWMAQGKTDGEIAVICGISQHTAQKHAQNIYIKLGVETRTAAMMRALQAADGL